MAVSNIKASFPCKPEKVWNLVTSLENYGWRSDIARIEVLESGNKFVEYTKDGYYTTFTITRREPYRIYQFRMENENMEGLWTGSFSFEKGTTVIDFTEDVAVKKFFMKPFAKMYLKKQQAAYIQDLKKALG